jgi:hypothetical protein
MYAAQRDAACQSDPSIHFVCYQAVLTEHPSVCQMEEEEGVGWAGRLISATLVLTSWV